MRRITCIVFLFFLIVFSDTTTVNAGVGVFSTTETKSSNLKPFFKWTGMLKRFEKKHFSNKKCVATKLHKCHKKEWKSFLGSLQGKDKKSQIKEVNLYMNKAEYILDIVNWGVQDYWATPYQFFIKDGDCEDYAIAKYISLKQLGFPIDKMRVVVLQDTNLGVIHAVLTVQFKGDSLILDNQITQVISSNRIHHYVPIYSINENNWWRHRKN